MGRSLSDPEPRRSLPTTLGGRMHTFHRNHSRRTETLDDLLPQGHFTSDSVQRLSLQSKTCAPRPPSPRPLPAIPGPHGSLLRVQSLRRGTLEDPTSTQSPPHQPRSEARKAPSMLSPFPRPRPLSLEGLTPTLSWGSIPPFDHPLPHDAYQHLSQFRPRSTATRPLPYPTPVSLPLFGWFWGESREPSGLRSGHEGNGPLGEGRGGRS